MSDELIVLIKNWGPAVGCVLALNVLGLVLKQAANLSVPEDFPRAKAINALFGLIPSLIPIILPAVGSVFAWLKGLDPLLGFVLGGMAVWGHQVVKQVYASQNGGQNGKPGERAG